MSGKDLSYFTDTEDWHPETSDAYAPTKRRSKEAWKLVDDFAKRTNSGLWHHISRRSLVLSLRQRIDFPDETQQGSTNLCGVSVMVSAWAYECTVQYVTFAIDIFEKGRGFMVGRNPQAARSIQPSVELRTAVPPIGMEHADWLVSASIRESLNRVFNYTPGEGIFAIKAFTTPGDVVTQFRALGYRNVRDTVSIAKTQGYGSLMEASHLYQSHWRVVLLINSWLIGDRSRRNHLIRYGNHWVALSSAIVPVVGTDSQAVRPLQRWSGGSKGTTVSDGGKPILLSDVIHSYFGYIAGRF
ncbi:MAG: hypothetical protein RL701_5143 [Pseudomonadota bacterium]|jgi:hypothetical protein